MKVLILLCMLAVVAMAIPAQDENLAGVPCTPGERRMMDCNFCTCRNDGKGFYCTRIACPPKRDPKVPVNSPGFTCTPGEHFRDDCNRCTCTSSGRTAACTHKLCIHSL